MVPGPQLYNILYVKAGLTVRGVAAFPVDRPTRSALRQLATIKALLAV